MPDVQIFVVHTSKTAKLSCDITKHRRVYVFNGTFHKANLQIMFVRVNVRKLCLTSREQMQI